MSAISAINLSKRYRRAVAVDNVSFDIAQGEIVGFLGPNGAGKTTTLRMLAGLIRPSTGSSKILGQQVPSSSLLQVGTMIEEPSFYKYMSGRDNLSHAGKLHGNVDESYIDEVLSFVNMDKAAKKKVGAYSQGMRQRLGLARALLWKPKVLLLDEPTNGLDPVGIAEIRENLRTIAEQGVTILISSHILAEIEKLVERILAIEKGKLLFDGPIKQLLHRIDSQSVKYQVSATKQDDLLKALKDLDLTPQEDGNYLSVVVPINEASGLLRSLINKGIELLEARQVSEDLEGAYLRLLKDDGKPS